MILTVHHQDRATLAELLAAAGFPLDLRCGGNGRCGRCRVNLGAGRWILPDGREIELAETDATHPANACRTRLAGAAGRVEVPDGARAPGTGRSAVGWSAAALPATAETVIGVDLGTTTLAAVKIRNGKIIGRAGNFNRQSRFGDNVVSRIQYASRGPEALAELQNAAVESINELLSALGSGDACRVAVAGNTVMCSLLHGIDPAPIGVMPFTPPCRIFPETRGGALGLDCDAPVFTAPAIAGYVGGDLTAGIGETVPAVGEMLVDIGTNCEIVFHAASGWVCTAAAAGPAFEGAGIAAGRRAVSGAIDHWFGDGRFHTLDDAPPEGICGSAMIDFLAVERRAGHLSEFGRYEPAAAAFCLAPGVELGEADIEQLLKAKSAVRAGIECLAAYCGERPRKIYLAGGFAQYLDLGNAIAIGMLPTGNYEIVGNTSLAGAARLAVDPVGYGVKLAGLIDLPREVALNTLPGFEDVFIDSLLLP